MIDTTPTIQFPQFLPCTESKWQELNAAADELLGFPNEGAETYSTPVVDKNGQFYFMVQPETASLVYLSKCVQYSEIKFKQVNIK